VDFPLSTSCEAVDRADATLLPLFIPKLNLPASRQARISNGATETPGALVLQDLSSFYSFYLRHNISKNKGHFLQIFVEPASESPG
jgi:hypothetical protein